jgi:hypothetical protein
MIDSQIKNALRFRHISPTAIAICLFPPTLNSVEAVFNQLHP